MVEPNKAETEIKVLLMAPNWLGDAVMFSALLEYLHYNRILPDGRRLNFELAVRSAWAPLFLDDQRLQKILTVDRSGRHGGFSGAWNLGADFKKRKPEAILLGPPSLRAGFAAWKSGSRIRVGYKSDGRGPFLSCNLPVPERGTSHHSKELLSLGKTLLDELGCTSHKSDNTNYVPCLPGCDSYPQITLSSSAPLWVFAPGATYGSAKSWPLKPATDFVRQAIEDRGARLLVLGDAAATVFAESLAENLNCSLHHDIQGEAGLVDLTGRTDLGSVVSILKASRVFVGNDSGLMHLAAALGTPTVGIFGSSNPDWTRPMGPRTQVVTAEGYSCRPCYLKSCNQKEFCMETIPAIKILDAIDKLIESAKD